MEKVKIDKRMNIVCRKILAFTLIEVLITLVIIGVVGAMTLPNLIANYRAEELRYRFYKVYSSLSQGFDKLYADGICTTQNCITNGTYLLKLMPSIFRIEKICKDGSKDKDCFQKSTIDNEYSNYTGTTSYINTSMVDDGQFFTSEGMLITFEVQVSNNKGRIICSDINGRKKKPNKYGHDLFCFQIITNGDRGIIFPMGAEETIYSENLYCSKTSTNLLNGIGCASKALHDKDFFKNLP